MATEKDKTDGPGTWDDIIAEIEAEEAAAQGKTFTIPEGSAAVLPRGFTGGGFTGPDVLRGCTGNCMGGICDCID